MDVERASFNFDEVKDAPATQKAEAFVQHLRKVLAQVTEVSGSGVDAQKQRPLLNLIKTDLTRATASFLPPYDRNTCAALLRQAEAAVHPTRSSADRSGKFSFSSKLPTRPRTEPTAAPSPSSQAPLSAKVEGDVGIRVENVTGEDLTRDATRDRKVVLSNLTDCTVHLPDAMTSINLTNLTRCRVFAGPATVSAWIDKCTGCTFHLACHQVVFLNYALNVGSFGCTTQLTLPLPCRCKVIRFRRIVRQ